MAINIVGYTGIDTFDIILYLSRILLKLDRRILLIDHSETQALESSIPEFEGLNTEKGIVSFRHVDFTRMTINERIAGDYDDILIAYGFHEPAADKALLTHVIYATDLYEYNQERINEMRYYDTPDTVKQLLIRDVVNVKITPEIIARRINKNIRKENIKILYLEEEDLFARLICNYNKTPRFVKLSGPLKAYLMQEAGILYPEAKRGQIRKAYYKARKGD